MIDNLEPRIGDAKPVSATRLYSPGLIAAYTVLANIPCGLVLYGLNLRARGQHRFGTLLLLFGGILSILTIALSMNDAMPRYGILIGPVTAAYIYQLEKRPFHKALSEGAVRARWWFPAVWLLGVMVLLFVVESVATG